MALSPGRVTAARALMDAERGRHVDHQLRAQAPENPADRGLAWNLALGVLRHRGQLHALLRPHIHQELDELEAKVRVVLELGAYEHAFTRVPRHAVVDQAVELARKLGVGRASGLVNAVLRRVDAAHLNPDPRLNHPAWLVQRWEERYGAEAVTAWCERLDTPPPLAMCGRVPESLQTRAGTVGGEAIPGCWWVDSEGSVSAIEGFAEGDWWVMDPSAAACADLIQAQPGEAILDACAAPGGKTFRLLSQGAVVTASDRSGKRLEKLKDSLVRLKLEADVQVADLTQAAPRTWRDQYDAVLVDAPCTALGTTRRHPESRWSRRASDPLAMSLRQLEILGNASTCVKPGGRLVYAVCSPEPEEGREVVASFLERGGFRLDVELDKNPPSADEDAFYAARMVREQA